MANRDGFFEAGGRPYESVHARRRGSTIAAALGLLLAACAGDDRGTATAGASSSTTGTTAEETTTGGESTSSSTAATTDASGTMSGGETSGTSGTGTSGTSGTSTTGVEPGCGDGIVDAGEACDDGNADDFDGCLSDCTEVELLEPPAMEWKYYEIEGTKCLDGSTAGFGVNHNPDSTNVMIYLEGGGACFSDACDFTAFSIPFVPPIDGIFSRSNDNNPVRDWTMVYVPYCSGDIHGGDNEAELGGQTRYFYGYRNVTRYLEVLVPSFTAERVLLTGISAGGFGSALNASQVAEAYGDGVELTVVDDSGPPLSNEVIAPCLQQIFRETWGLDKTILAECPECDGDNFASDLLDHVLATYPDVRFGLFSNTGDQIIRSYMGAGWGNGEHDNCEGLSVAVPIGAYADDLDALRAAHKDVTSTFYLTGLGHTVLRVGYNITSIDGTSVPEWVGQVLAGEITHVGP
jgi:cysteine-rich repeat protein